MTSRDGGRRRGFSLLETLWSLLLLALVVQGGWTVLAHQRTVTARLGGRMEGLETIRTIDWLLPAELSSGRPGEDWWMAGGDSVALRAFRGLGIVEEQGPAPDEVAICFRGIRAPDTEKDSVLLLETDGRWKAHELRRRVGAAGSCPGLGGGSLERWYLSPEPGDGVVARLFERGTYYLADGALRYRRGDGGRQPLTPPRVHSGAIRGFPDEGPRMWWEVQLVGGKGASPGIPWMGPLR